MGRGHDPNAGLLAGDLTDLEAPRRGDIYWVDFDPVMGSEQGGHRPACVISLDSFNRNMPVVAVAAITTRIRESPLTVFLPQGRPLEKASMILPFQVRTVDQTRLEDFAGELSLEQIGALEAKLRLCWGL